MILHPQFSRIFSRSDDQFFSPNQQLTTPPRPVAIRHVGERAVPRVRRVLHEEGRGAPTEAQDEETTKVGLVKTGKRRGKPWENHGFYILLTQLSPLSSFFVWIFEIPMVDMIDLIFKF